MLKKAWSWPVVSVLLPIVLGAGLTFMTTSHPWVADLSFVGSAVLFLCKFWTWEETRSQEPKKKRLLLTLVSFTIMAATFVVCWWNHRINQTPLQDTTGTSPQLPVALSMGCSIATLPIVIHPDTPIQVMFLNPLVTHNKGHEVPGFTTVGNSGSTDLAWPSKQSRIKNANPSLEAWKCDLQNTGPTNLAEIAMAAKIYYGSNTGDNFDQHVFEINPLAAGNRHAFYLVNQCPINASVILGDSAELQVVGESKRRQVPVSWSGGRPLENILMFFPTKYHHGMPCSADEVGRLPK